MEKSPVVYILDGSYFTYRRNTQAEQDMNNIKKGRVIITHPKKAHRDDFLSCCILMHILNVPLHRRLPSQEELDDPTCVVVDVGTRHEPELNNYDHHQLVGGQSKCALTLILKSMRVYTLAHQLWNWLEPTEILDTRGYKALAKWTGLAEPRKILPLHSPVEKAMLKLFCMAESIYPGETLYDTMVFIGGELMDELDSASRRMVTLRREKIIYDLSVGKIFRALPHNAGENAVVLEITVNRYFADVEAVIADDAFSNGWIIHLRPKNQGRWDFRKIRNLFPYISICAEDNGRWVKTNRPLDVEELETLFNALAKETSE